MLFILPCIFKNNQHRSSKLIKYILFTSNILILVKECVCLMTNDYQTRLYLYDLSLFLGGLRQFTNVFLILANFFSIKTFYNMYLRDDELKMKWLELIQVVVNYDFKQSLILFKHNMDKVTKVKRFASSLSLVTWLSYLFAGK